jgi:hypothetical protein
VLRRLIQTGLAVAAVAAVASVAYGAIPSADGTITACVDKGGELRLIDAEAAAACGNNKQTLTWNQQGPAGPGGPAGADGEDGAPGEDGQDGVSGYQREFAVGPADSVFRKELEVACPTGKKPVGGGGAIESLDQPLPPIGVALLQSYPTSNGWYVMAEENPPNDSDWKITARVICAAAS